MYKTLTSAVRLLLLGMPVCLTAATAAAQTPPARDLTALSIEDLLTVEVVSTASKFPQEVREAPASITVVTADEIRRYGHRTLADTLRSVRGFYTTYDRNYSYVGMRGFSRPGDYNTRILLLLDGHRLNDGIYDMAPIGTDFPIDVSLIERIEIIRGPGSSLYGTNAFFAVINVVTHTGAGLKGLQVETQAGSLETHGATASFGRLLGNGREVLLGGSVYRSAGQANIHFPEFDTDEPGSGVASGLDHDKSATVFGSLQIGRFALRGGVVNRRKQVPTASFKTIFGDDRLTVADNRAFLSAVYEGPIRRGWSLTGRLAYDYYGYEGFFPYDYGEPEPVMWLDLARSDTGSGELTLQRRFAGRHLVTVGAEMRRQFKGRMSAEDNTGFLVDLDRPGTILGAYVQDEVHVFPWLLVNAGVRIDRYPTFGSRATPRVGLVLLPRPQTAVKVLHGRAFRAPNPYELYYFSAMEGRTLDPETVRNTELVWEEYISGHVRTAVTAFRYRADKIIEQATVETDFVQDIYFRNVGGVSASGFEAEVEVKLARGLSSRASHSYARARDRSGVPISNSPAHMSKVGLQIPVASFFVGVEGQYTGERLTLDGEPLAGFFVPNITLTSPAGRRVGFRLSVYNAFDHTYADPGGEEHLSHSIQQDGRTVLARVRVGF